MSRDIFTIRTVWERRDGGVAWMRPTTIFLGQEPHDGEFEQLDDETRELSDDEVAESVLQGVMIGVHMIERTIPVRYVPPEEFDRLVKEIDL